MGEAKHIYFTCLNYQVKGQDEGSTCSTREKDSELLQKSLRPCAPLSYFGRRNSSLSALKAKVNIAEDLPKYLCHAGAKQSSSTQTENHHGEPDNVPSSSLPYNCEILTTNCCLKELEDLGPPGHGALCVLRQYTIKPCGHAEPIPPVHCLLSILKGGNPGQFILASMHDELKQKAQNIAQVPILYLNGPAPVLEKPSERAVQLAE